MATFLVVEKGVVNWEGNGLAPRHGYTFYVKFIFEDNGENQNAFQGDTLKLHWMFDAGQTKGEEK